MKSTLTLVSAAALAASLAGPIAAQEPPADGTIPGFGVLPGPEAGTAPAPAAEPAPDATTAEETDPQETGPEETELEETEPEETEPEAETPETDEAEAEAPEAEAPTDPLQTPDLDTAETLRETHGEWEVHCDPTRPSDCVMGQIGEDDEGNPVVEVQVVRLPDGSEAAALMTVVSPLGTLLPAGIGLQVDGGQVQRHGFIYCGPRGCVSELALPQQLVTSMQRGRVARLLVTALAAPDDPVEVDLSLIGFTAAYNAIPAPE